MFVDFSSLNSDARIWVYLADKTVSETDNISVASFLKEKINGWMAHGAVLEGSFKIIENRFLIIAVNENRNLPSGCSIDSSVSWIKEIHEKLGIDFLSNDLAYKSDEGIKTISVFQLKKNIENSIITAETAMYDQRIQTLEQLNGAFLKPARTLFERYFAINA